MTRYCCQGIVVAWSVPLLAGAIIALLAGPAAAQDICEQITVINCPTQFVDDCKDPTFRDENLDACFDAVSGAIQDQPVCTDPAIAKCKPKAECEAMEDPVDQHFCKAGQSQCEKSVPGLLAEYDSVLKGLETSLARYGKLTTLDLGQATSIEVLCAYKIEELVTLQAEAETELNDFSGSEDSIGAIDQCSSTLQSFIDAGAPARFPAETWSQIANTLTAGMGQMQLKQGQIESSIAALKDAPLTLRSLRTAYRVICPKPAP